MVPAPRPNLPSGYPNSSPRRYHHHYSRTDFDRDTENPSRMETYYGHVRTPLDAIILFEACRLGLLPRVQRRLSEKERQAIRSGSVFVWDEREAGMRRWTDGKSWSASRVSGSFLTYREMEGKRGLSSRNGKSPDSKGSDEDREGQDDGLDGYRYKPDGLMKQSFSITTSTGQHLHLISYYSRSHPSTSNLQQPSTDPALRHIQPQKGLYPESTINDQQSMPPVTRGSMASAAYHLPPHVAAFPPNGVTHPSSYPAVYGWTLTPLTAAPPTVTIPYPGPGYAPIYPGPYGPPPSLPVPPPTHHHALPAPLERPPPVNTSAAAIAASQAESRRPSMASLASHQQHSDSQQSSPQYSHSSPTDSRPSLTPRTPRMSQLPPPTTAQDAPSSSTSTTVPSIGSLVNGSSQPTTSLANTSPNGVPPAKGPRDIPSEKLTFGGEDVRALQKLNSVFTA